MKKPGNCKTRLGRRLALIAYIPVILIALPIYGLTAAATLLADVVGDYLEIWRR